MRYLRRHNRTISCVIPFSIFFLCHAAFATDAGQSERLDVLSIPRTQTPLGASQPCGSDASNKNSSEILSSSGQPRQHAPACMVRVESAIDALAKGRVTIVDTRTADEFNKYRIPSSLNIPLHAVKTKAFLKSQAFLLVNENHTSVDLETACSNLKREGYNKVGVLQGGLFLWHARGGILDGDTIAARRLSTIRPAELVQELPLKDWLIIDVSNRKNPAMKKHFPGEIGRAHV